MLDLTFPKMVIPSTERFSCTCILRWKEWSGYITCTAFPLQIGQVEDNSTIA